ncbi:MAG: DUF1697 domain-containing protein [Polyangiaceae bacterium]
MGARTQKPGSIRRYAAFLRGVSPMNVKLPELRRALEGAGFADVRTVLTSGNVVFSAPKGSNLALAQELEAAMSAGLDRSFPTIVRSLSALQRLLRSDPFAEWDLDRGERCTVTFLRIAPRKRIELPLEHKGVRILQRKGLEVFCCYREGAETAFIPFIEKTFGKNLTTRTWQTLEKVAR